MFHEAHSSSRINSLSGPMSAVDSRVKPSSHVSLLLLLMFVTLVLPVRRSPRKHKQVFLCHIGYCSPTASFFAHKGLSGWIYICGLIKWKFLVFMLHLDAFWQSSTSMSARPCSGSRPRVNWLLRVIRENKLMCFTQGRFLFLFFFLTENHSTVAREVFPQRRFHLLLPEEIISFHAIYNSLGN